LTALLWGFFIEPNRLVLQCLTAKRDTESGFLEPNLENVEVSDNQKWQLLSVSAGSDNPV